MRPLILVLVAGLLSLFMFNACKQSSSVFNFKSHPVDDSAKRLVLLTSDYISWDDVVPMIKAYNANSNALTTRLPGGSTKVLEGLQLDADHLRAMLSDQTIRKVELYFAVNKSDLSKPGSQQTFTIVTAPVYFDLSKKVYRVKKYRNASGNRSDPANSELIDFCDPCPVNCPDTTQN
ncbi:MAG: hypothetical protein KF825_04210 [Ferruginibacter sp.]|nr:hypothetical protein [Ferruginibacter sp.]